MNKAWITGITVASVAGTGGAAYATMQASAQHDSASAEAPQSTAAITTTTEGAQAYEFQAGPAGVVHLTADKGVLRINSALPAAGWTLVDYTTPAAHVEVRLTDGTQIVTFAADIVNGEVTGSLSTAPAPTVPSTDPATTTPATPAPQPAVPPQQLAPAGQTPAPGHTSSPSSSNAASGGDDGSEHESDDSHESESENGDD